MKKGDEAMVISFDLDVDLLADFTDDRAQIQRAISKARIGAVKTLPLRWSNCPGKETRCIGNSWHRSHA